MAREIGAVQFYDSMVVIAKALKEPPVSLIVQNGTVTRSRKALTLRNRKSIF